MIVFVSQGGVQLLDAENFCAFKLKSPLPRAALAGLAHPDVYTLDPAGHAWVQQHWLARQGPAGDAVWPRSLAQMIEKARPHGRVSADG